MSVEATLEVPEKMVVEVTFPLSDYDYSWREV